MRLTTVCAFLLSITALAQTSPEKTFIDAYKNAHTKRDVAALKRLTYLERVPSEDPQISDPRFYNFDEPIESIRITPARTWPPDSCCDPETIFVRDGVRHEFNLPLAASLHIDYVPGKNSSQSRVDIPLGFKDGHYWITCLVPAPK